MSKSDFSNVGKLDSSLASGDKSVAPPKKEEPKGKFSTPTAVDPNTGSDQIDGKPGSISNDNWDTMLRYQKLKPEGKLTSDEQARLTQIEHDVRYAAIIEAREKSPKPGSPQTPQDKWKSDPRTLGQSSASPK